MSFILDALRKSETERQHKGPAEFANVPTSNDRRERPPIWLWVLGALLLINLAVLVGILLRPDVGAHDAVAESSPPPETVLEARVEEEPREAFASRVAAARENAPAVEEPPPVEEMPAATALPIAAPAATPAATPAASRPVGALPTVHEVRAQGRVTLPDLHVDIHVFSEVAGDRFVFINMNRHKEGSQLAEGPLVEEITPDGVVLSMNGVTFLLPRD
jgi:general secretion pathway protein B